VDPQFDLIERLPKSRTARVVDIGCGTGVMLREFPPGWDLVSGCDYSQTALEFSRRRGLKDLLRCDAMRLPMATGSIDLVLAIDVVEHLADDAGCLSEIARVCRPGGYVLLHVPTFQILWSDKDVLNHHQRRYRREQFLALVERCGLAVERARFINSFVFPAALVRSLAQRLLDRLRPRVADGASSSVDHLYRIPETVNRAMIGLMSLEWRTVSPWIPFGMSLVCLARKPLTEESLRPA
jgi:SAM-dependent methyltransferase